MTEERRKALIDDIIAGELRMFQAVNSRGGRSVCQERPESFCLMREMTHAVLSDDFLVAYAVDVRRAEEAGRNLMTEKYALMERRIPKLSTDPRIDIILNAECAWRREVTKDFPHVVQADGQPGFRLYLGCELQTYSGESLAAYEACVKDAQAAGRNLVRERYEILMRQLGHDSLEECEARLAAESSRCADA
jgi:hypothetical protein